MKIALLLLPALLLLGACATTGGVAGEPEIPEGAVSNTRTEANGDVVTEYRVGAQLRMIKVEPAGGPAYYLYDRDGDGRVDPDNNKSPMTYYKLFSW